ncbi:hypothetical protein HDC35_002711 [Sphingopyxis sp. JAI128]|nr:hypothetical protein [Sphingopyxis sp. JAI128]MBB6426967.1 hypothetical protein [Sphingopyxis sp. JAI128]
MLLNRAFGYSHMFGDPTLRKVLELLQLERLSAFWRQRLQYFVQARQFFLSAETPVNAHLFVNDVQRVQIRHKIDRDDTRAAKMLADNMARGYEEIGSRVADRLGIAGPEPRVSLLHHFIDIAGPETANPRREPLAQVGLVRKHLACKPAELGLTIHVGMASAFGFQVKKK